MHNFYPKMMGYSGGGGGGGGGAGGGGAGGSSGGGAAGGASGGAAGSGGGIGGLRVDNVCGEGGRNALSGSVYFNGYIADDTPSAYLSVPDSDDLDMGTGDFAFECWILAIKHAGTNDPNFMGICGSNSYTAGGILIQVNNTGPLRIAIPLAAGGYLDQSAGPELWGDGTSRNRDWNHIAVERSSGTLKGYVNGIEVISTTHNVGVDFAHGGGCNIGENAYGTYAGDYPFRGYISNLRICKGHIIYGQNFTPPSSPLSVHYTNENNKTVLLCCQNSDDPTQEATGKTITAYGGADFSHNPDNLIKKGRFTYSATENWTLSGGTAALGTGQSGTFNDGNHLVLTASSSYAYLVQAFTTKIGKTYRVNCQSNGGDQSYISTTSSESDAIITDIRTTTQTTDGRAAEKFFLAEQTTYYVILRGSTGGGNFDTVSVYEQKDPIPPKVLPPFGTDNGVTFDGAISMNSSDYVCFPTGRTEERGRGRGIICGGHDGSSQIKTIQYLEIQSTGNSIDFGDLTAATSLTSTFASSTRGVIAGGANPASINTIEFITISITSNATNFGDLTDEKRYHAGFSSQVRGITAGGAGAPSPARTNIIDFVTIASAGNASDFGDLTEIRMELAGASSPTRGLFMGGANPGVVNRSNVVDYVTIATAGNAQDFGDMTATYKGGAATSNNTRAIHAGGNEPSFVTDMEFFTIATTGGGTDFGDLTDARGYLASLSNSVRGVYAAGYDGSNQLNIIDFVTITTTGTASDFGDLLGDNYATSGSSDSHGGL